MGKKYILYINIVYNNIHMDKIINCIHNQNTVINQTNCGEIISRELNSYVEGAREISDYVNPNRIKKLYCQHPIGYQIYNQKILFYNELKRKKYEALLNNEYNDFIKLDKEIKEFETLISKKLELKEIEEKFKADAKATRKKMRNKVLADKKTRQQRINDILSGKFGVDNPYGLSPTELADLKSLGIDPNKAGPMTDIQQDIFDQMMEKNDRFSGVNLENFQNKFDLPTTGITSLDLVTGLLEGPLSKGAKYNKEFFTDDVLGAGKFKYDGNVVNPEIFSMLNPTEMQEIYGDYDTRRKSGEIDAYGNPTIPTGVGRDDPVSDPCLGPNPPAYCNVGNDTEEEEDEVNPRDYTGLAPRFMGSSFDFTGLAEGGRVAAQQGGIMPRLSDLSGDVSSAEQMLQEINQRLESAESTLGEGGGGGMFGAGNFGPGFNTNFNQQPLSPIAGSIQNQRQNSLNLPSALADPIRIRPSYEDALSDYNQRMESGMMTNDIERNKMRSRENYDSYNKQQDPAIINQRFQDQLQDYTNRFGQRSLMADGGRMRQMEMMQDEDDPTGGIMDLESGRQMYFLGKLVKKAGRAIKKVVKSPIGKAALLYFGGNALMSGGGGGLSSLFNSGKGLKLKEMFMGSVKPGGKGNRIGGLFNFMKDNPYLSILGGSTALAGLSGKDKDEDGPIDYGPGIDIDRLRYAPYRTLAPSIIGSNYQTGTEGRKDGGRMGYQEGGDAEPVAKKTMPLLDMDGQEMDLRAEGGFVPLGRMERADDVPARLSKNEFVFTADAVRNAGEGDIDKGAEVMYNMMKNLESGGEVSEESQGLDGAREMFKTSQRLEEVL